MTCYIDQPSDANVMQGHQEAVFSFSHNFPFLFFQKSITNCVSKNIDKWSFRASA